MDVNQHLLCVPVLFFTVYDYFIPGLFPVLTYHVYKYLRCENKGHWTKYIVYCKHEIFTEAMRIFYVKPRV